MIDERLVAIATKLLEQSRRREIPWSETADEHTFLAAFPTYSVSIEYKLGYNSYRLSIHDDNGTEIDSVESDDSVHLKGFGVKEELFSKEELFTTLKELFEEARHVGLKTDEVLDDLLAQLSSTV